ncbi:hypothetical protein FJY69_04945 [candidate division WOR-3 bacterium]|nr:hypothetical protein [candidate division WOR-3 bacterium]
MIRLLLCVLIGFGPALAQNLLVNGDFEQDLSVGWTQNPVGAGTHTFDRGTSYHPDPDFEAYLQQYSGAGSTSLDQMVSVSNLNLDFSFWAKMNLGAGSSTCWPVSAVILGYYDRDNAFQGDTRFYYPSPYCNWVSTGTTHLIQVPNTDWNRFQINVYDELTQNLPDIPIRFVQKLKVSVFTATSGG